MEKYSIDSIVNPEGRKVITVVTGRKYKVLSSGKCEFIEDVLQEEPENYEDIEYPGRFEPELLKRDVDLHTWKLATDIVVQGMIRTNAPVKNIDVTLECIGDDFNLSQTIIATGDRYVEKGRVGFQLSEPVPFTEMPMRYDKAYGGTDYYAEEKMAVKERQDLLAQIFKDSNEQISDFAYPRNPAGKGYLILDEGKEGLAWPNLEFPDEKLRLKDVAMSLYAWGKRPYPACFDWVPYGWFPRQAFLVDFFHTEDECTPEREVKMGILPKNLLEMSFDERPMHGFAQCSHPFLWRHRFLGNEEIMISHMSQDGRSFYIKLPNHPPKIEIQLLSSDFKTAQTELDLMFVETEEDTVTLIWRGFMDSPKDFLPPNWEKTCGVKIS